MPSGDNRPPTDREAEFQRLSRGGQTGIIAEFLEYLRATGKWWLVPILLALLLIAFLLLAASSPWGLLIYPI
jgi:hypothetical protein